MLKESVIGIVLAGGESRRMGQDKALLQLDNVTQLERAEQVLKSSGCTELLISRNQASAHKQNTKQFIPDLSEYHLMGPLSGIYSSLKFYQSYLVEKMPEKVCCVVIPVDMPLLKSQQLITLIEYTQYTQQACYLEHSFMPCCFYVTLEELDLLKDNLDNQKLSLKGFLKQLDAKSLAADSQQLLNTNTPAEWQQVVDQYSAH